MIQHECPQCQLMLQIDERYAGRRGKCKRCGCSFTVPLASPPQSIGSPLTLQEMQPDWVTSETTPVDAVPSPVSVSGRPNLVDAIASRKAFRFRTALTGLNRKRIILGGIVGLVTFSVYIYALKVGGEHEYVPRIASDEELKNMSRAFDEMRKDMELNPQKYDPSALQGFGLSPYSGTKGGLGVSLLPLVAPGLSMILLGVAMFCIGAILDSKPIGRFYENTHVRTNLDFGVGIAFWGVVLAGYGLYSVIVVLYHRMYAVFG